MTFADRVDSLAARFLSERSYELIVAPAIADLQFDHAGQQAPRATARLSVLAACAGAVYEDLTTDSGALQFAGLALIPACYYTLLILLCVPQAFELIAGSAGYAAVGVLIATLSFGPVLACCWPERGPTRPAQDSRGDA